MPPTPRPEVLKQAPAYHGAARMEELRRYGLRPEEVLDFSVNINPFGASPRAQAALAAARLNAYPDREALPLREALAAHHNLPLSHILVGNGTAELITLIAAAFIRPGDWALVIAPTFGEYARATALFGGRMATLWAQTAQNFAFPQPEIAHTLQRLHPRIVWLCNPNNPTGQWLALDILAQWAQRHPHTLFVVDEAYINFHPRATSAIGLAENVLVLRSMTKDYALAGLRLGYAVGSPPLIQALQRVQPPWSVSAPAQAAGLAALEDQAHLTHTLAATRAAKHAFVHALTQAGWHVLPSATHFFLLYVGQARAFRHRLLLEGILVRDGTSFGLPAYVRLGTRRPEENARLLETLHTAGLTPPTPPEPEGRPNPDDTPAPDGHIDGASAAKK